jgi:ribosomal protein L37AE/L43A
MSAKQVTIYHARTAQDAEVLKNILAEAGIRALVSNVALANGAGTDILGWPSLAQVVVDEDDALAARRIAEEFDRQETRGNSESQDEPATSEPAAYEWPTCPQCGQRRTTSCPACGTSGTRFRWGDRMPEEMEDAESASAPTCICPTCDEPFVPRFLAVCEWCGHRFEGGAPQASAGPAQPTEQMNHRVTMTLWALIVFIAVVVVFFAMMWR